MHDYEIFSIDGGAIRNIKIIRIAIILKIRNIACLTTLTQDILSSAKLPVDSRVKPN